MKKYNILFVAGVLMLVILYPKFPLFGVGGTFVAVRMEDLIISLVVSWYLVKKLFNRFSGLDTPVSRSIFLYWLAGAVATFCGIFLLKAAPLSLGILHFVRRIEYMALFFVAYDFLQDKIQLRYVIRLLLLISVIVSLYGLGQLFFGLPVVTTNNSEFSKGLSLSLGPGARINSTFAGHYDLAAFTALPLLLVMGLFKISRNKIPLIIIWLLIYWCLLLSGSRIVFASFMFCGVIMLFLTKQTKLILFLGLMAVIGFFSTSQLRGRFAELLKNQFRLGLATPVLAASREPTPGPVVVEDRSYNIRLQAEWPKALRSFSKNPILGTGFSSIGLATDNEFLRILAETGLLGLMSFILIIINLFKGFKKYLTEYQFTPESIFVLTSLLYLVHLLLSSIFIDYFTASKIAISTWAIMGLAYKVQFLKKAHA